MEPGTEGKQQGKTVRCRFKRGEQSTAPGVRASSQKKQTTEKKGEEIPKRRVGENGQEVEGERSVKGVDLNRGDIRRRLRGSGAKGNVMGSRRYNHPWESWNEGR